MPLSAGARVGPYQILSLLGAGGMGEVYRASDTKLGRDVALKLLPAVFAADLDRRARFEREAKTLAALNHPNIAAIYGLEAADGVTALIMELIEGDDLARRIARGPIPWDEALPMARRIAEALEAAHDQGIIHRDLKPANIMVRGDGTVKVPDFGLAKALAPEVGRAVAADVSQSPTITSRALLTGVGMILGTAAYMSPEQIKGRPADKRSDLWSFGCVVYEMLVGRRAFPGDDVSDTFANVLKNEPDWRVLPPPAPGEIRTLLRRCLTKDRHRRLDSVAAARLHIDDALTSPAADAPFPLAGAPRVARWRTGASVAVVLLAALTAGFVWWAPRSGAPGVVTRFEIILGGDQNPNFSTVALSPDGTRLAYTTSTSLYLRALNDLNPREIARGNGITVPRSVFFSADGQWIGFWQDGQLKKVSVNGGAPVTPCALESPPLGATWSADNSILFGSAQGPAGVWRVSGNSGTPERIITVEAGQRAHGPQLLPDGRTVLFTLAEGGSWNEAQLVVQSINGGAPRRILSPATDGRYVPTGHLVYALRGTVLAAAFDLSSATMRGGSIPLLDNVRQGTTSGTAQFAVSGSGTLAYVPAPTNFAGARRTLAWVDRQGREEAIAAPPRPYIYPRLAPDGRRIALDIADENRDIWVWHLPHGPLQRVTSDAAIDRVPVWTPDGEQLIFSSDRDDPGGVANLYRQAADGSPIAERLTHSTQSIWAHSMSPDGRRLVVRQTPRGTSPDLMTLDVPEMHGDSAPSSRLSEPNPLVQTSALEFNGEFSPDGRWLAYQSNTSNTYEVFVAPFPNPTGKLQQVSVGGGTEPLWAPNRQELFYRGPTGAVMRVARGPGPDWTFSPPVQVFDASPYVLGGRGDFFLSPMRTYDVSLDGERFLMIKNDDTSLQTPAAQRVVVVQHWFTELQQRVPTR